jgi:proteasomal ATPase-associated factor 1
MEDNYSQYSTILVPQITVQHDISGVIEDVRDGIVQEGWEDVWVSCYCEGKPSVHGKLRISRTHLSGSESVGGTAVAYDARDGIEWHGSSAVSMIFYINLLCVY